jgi:3-methylfumaryl-CoA hydratase
MTVAIDIDAYRDWIGREERASDIVTPELVRRYLATLDLPMDEPRVGDFAPSGLHWCLAPPVVAQDRLGPDGHPARGGFLPPVALPRRMWAGGELLFHSPIRIGDAVQRLSRIEDVKLKQGRTGPLCFITVRHILGVDGVVAVEERQDIVYRGGEALISAASGGASQKPSWSKSVDASETRLFRYSALTFNGHRIHYDRRYCQEVEGYPGLVVHGPLQATLLLLFATELRAGRPPRSFSFRSVATIFGGTNFRLCAIEAPTGLRLWTADMSGREAMGADAVW